MLIIKCFEVTVMNILLILHLQGQQTYFTRERGERREYAIIGYHKMATTGQGPLP